ncbi:MAG: SH3 domain-containing protein, partial [Gemmatimonadota bacterium]|nr:SH3 domain-containing protein [Gemmatimonadota bacterium]
MRLLRSCVLLALVTSLTPAIAPSVGAQVRVVRDAGVRATPDGTLIATLAGGSTWPSSSARNGFTLVTMEVWIDATRFAGRRDSFPESIGGTGTLRMRAEPSLNARILGVFEAGAGIRVLERRGTWARVRRDGWVLTSALGPATATRTQARATPPPMPSSAPPAGAADSTPSEPMGRAGTMRATREADLSAAPGAPAVGRIAAGAVVEPLARDRGWVRVRVEAWMPESLLAPTDTSYRATLTAADLRLDPVGLKGRLVRWTVQVVGVQQADPLRRDLAPDEPYLLAMGPAGENAILYLALPPSLVAEARALAPLSEVTV